MPCCSNCTVHSVNKSLSKWSILSCASHMLSHLVMTVKHSNIFLSLITLPPSGFIHEHHVAVQMLSLLWPPPSLSCFSSFISYPRTETNIFPANLPLSPLVEQQTQSPVWGTFAQRVLEQPGGPNPRQGKKSDQAHPPIHPIKYSSNLQVKWSGLNFVQYGLLKHQSKKMDYISEVSSPSCVQGNEGRLYEFIVRHFLACVSQDALGQETMVDIDIAQEKFSTAGLMIIARNYLDVYPYDRWSAKVCVCVCVQLCISQWSRIFTVKDLEKQLCLHHSGA